MTLRSDIHAALEGVTPPAPHLPTTAVDAALRAEAPGWRARRALVLVAAALPLLLVIGGIATLRAATAPATPAARPTGTPVFTTWVPDPSINAGPFPGYRPDIRIRYRVVASAHAARDPNGAAWTVVVTFTPAGRLAFASLTTAAYHACVPGACPESHVTAWLDLTPDDVAHWQDRAGVLYQPVGAGGKLLADPYVQEPITGGTLVIEANLSRSDAEALARRLNPAGG